MRIFAAAPSEGNRTQDLFTQDIPLFDYMKTGIPLLCCAMLILMLVACGCTAPPPQKELTGSGNGPMGIPQGSGQYVFTDLLGNADRPITVYTYRPASWNTLGPVLMVMPGAGRDGRSPRDTWIRYAEQYSSLVAVPEFSLANYPGDLWYNAGNTYDDNNWNPKANWTYTAVEHLFDDLRNKSGATRNTYLLFGHSAGGQFVHRMATVLPEARYSRAVAANAGFYLLPVSTIEYPFGLKGSPLYENELPSVFARKLIIMSGGSDTDPNTSGLANFPEAEAQGSTRFERARFYFTTAQAEAERRHIPLNWEYHVVPGIGHDEAGMAGASAALLFNET
jgi:pimeloyl-ACP methyl ester carboxylesterase